MTKNILIYAFILPVTFFSISHRASAQDSTATSNADSARIDSLVMAYNKQEKAKDHQRRDSENLSDLKSEREETRAKAKEAQRVEADANDAARESKMAYRKEKRAQRAREQADRQAQHAAGARDISDKN